MFEDVGNTKNIFNSDPRQNRMRTKISHSFFKNKKRKLIEDAVNGIIGEYWMRVPKIKLPEAKIGKSIINACWVHSGIIFLAWRLGTEFYEIIIICLISLLQWNCVRLEGRWQFSGLVSPITHQRRRSWVASTRIWRPQSYRSSHYLGSQLQKGELVFAYF